MMRQIKKSRFFITFLLLISMLFQITGEVILAQETYVSDLPLCAEKRAETKEYPSGIPLCAEIRAKTEGISEENGVTVYDREEFMAALANRKSPIVIGSTMISIGNQAEASGRMLPVVIPEETVIRGSLITDQNGKVWKSEISSRAPIQLAGDGVVFENVKLTFESSDVLGSIPHREIFLAGHSLTLDNVNTYLEGDGGSMGPMGSSEAELLPTVYAGGYPGTTVGTNASLTVQNSEPGLETCSAFKGIYMGHEAGADDNVPYKGTARLNLEPSVIVREGIYVNQNSEAEVCITGSGTLRDLELYGNSHTTLSIRQSTLENVAAEQIGSVVLEDSAWFAPKTNVFYNISLKNNACLDFSGVSDVFILGDLKGQDTGQGNGAGQSGLLVLASDGRLDISGTVTGQTRFWTGNRVMPGILFHKWPYITASRESEQEYPFVLSDKDTENGFRLDYIDDAWTAWNDTYKDPVEIGSIEITSAPSAVDVSTIIESGDGSIPNEAAFCKITWRDQSGNIIADEDVVSEEMLFYEYDYVVCIKTEYWESEDPAVLEKTDWYNFIQLMPSEEHPGNYYLYSYEDPKAFTGEYTLLFCSEAFPDLYTVADVKALEDTVKAECNILFFDSTDGTPDLPSVHTHTYEEQITETATCSKTGKKTFTCTFAGCGDTHTAEIPKTAHTVVNDEREEPTCTQDGKTAGSHCGVCNTVIREQRHIPMTGHTEVIDPAKEATCSKEGKTQGSHCSVCNTVIVEQESIPMTKHTEVEDAAKEATCSEEGKTAGSHCSVCNTVIVEQESIPMTKHTEVEDAAKEATCSEEGKTAGSHCSVCNTVIVAQESIPRTAHDYKTQVTKASIYKGGYSKTECTRCGSVLGEYVVASPKKVVLSLESYVYDGTAKTPVVTVTDSSGKHIEREYYTVTFRNNKDVGLAEVKVTFRDIYEGTLTKNFRILPKPTVLKKITAKNKSIQIKWKKQAGQTTGYMIQYSMNRKFSGKGTKDVTVNGSKTVSKKIKKLKAGKKYFVRICTYKTVQSGGENVKLCSAWSKVKSVKMKK